MFDFAKNLAHSKMSLNLKKTTRLKKDNQKENKFHVNYGLYNFIFSLISN